MTSEKSLGVVLVVGGCGYLGTHLVRHLRSELTCTAIHVMSRDPTENLQPAVNYHAGDITNQEHVASILSKIKPRVIFHVASPRFTSSEKVLRKTNIDGTRILLKCAAESENLRAFVYTSSDAAVIQIPGCKMKEEQAVLHTAKTTSNPYELTKAIADSDVLVANNPPSLSTAVIRIPICYGENDWGEIGTLVPMIKKGQHKIQIGNNESHFEFVYVQKACTAQILAAKALLGPQIPKERVDGEAFFVSDGVSEPYFDVARKVFAFAGHPVVEKEIQVLPYWFVMGFTIVLEWAYWAFTFGTKVPEARQRGIEYLGTGSEWDISKARDRLGYEPVADRDVVLKRLAEAEAKRLGL